MERPCGEQHAAGIQDRAGEFLKIFEPSVDEKVGDDENAEDNAGGDELYAGGEHEREGDHAGGEKGEGEGDEVFLVKLVAFGHGGFFHGPGVEEMVGGVDQPDDDAEEDVALGEEMDVEDSCEESGGDDCAECDVEA